MLITRRRRRRRSSGVTYYASDAFTDTTNTVVTSHTPVAVATAPAGTAWVGTNGAVPEVQIQGNRVTKVGTAVGMHRAVLNGGVTPSDHSVTADLALLTALDGQITVVCARASTADVSGYYLQYTIAGASGATSFFALMRTDAAFASTQIGANYSFAFSASTVPVEIRCVGGAISVNVNGVLNVISGTDASPLTGTRAGIAFQQGVGGSSTLTTGVHIDNLVIRSPS